MPDPSIQHEPLPSWLRQIDLVADMFERQWREGEHPRIAAYLDKMPAEIRLRLLLELVCIDLEYRLRNHHSVTLDDYIQEFPELASLPASDRADLEAHAQQRFIDLSRTVDYVSATGAVTNCPQSIGRYLINGCLDSGGQADIYLSFHPELLVPVVVKWQHAQEPQDVNYRDQLVCEGRALASLGPHPNLVRVYDLGFHEGRPFLVLEYVPGLTLEQHAQDKRLDPRQVAKLVAGLARGAHAAHEQGAIHQDINPRNVVLDGLGEPRLIDFGLAWFRPSWAEPNAAARPDGGTLLYLSPEQADPRISPVSRRTDVFGLGAVLYFLLTGRPLYDGTDLRAVIGQAGKAAYSTAALERSGAPKQLVAICRKALARDPQSRYATAGELAERGGSCCPFDGRVGAWLRCWSACSLRPQLVDGYWASQVGRDRVLRASMSNQPWKCGSGGPGPNTSAWSRPCRSGQGTNCKCDFTYRPGCTSRCFPSTGKADYRCYNTTRQWIAPLNWLTPVRSRRAAWIPRQGRRGCCCAAVPEQL